MTKRRRTSTAVLFVLAVLAPAPALAQTAERSDGARIPVPALNGPARSLAVVGDRLVFGGSFTRVAMPAGPGVELDVATGATTQGPSELDPCGHVYAAVPDGSGGWYIGGSFTIGGSTRRQNLAHVLADGRLDPSFDPRVGAVAGPPGSTPVPPTVFGLALADGRLFVGGSFSSIGGRSRAGLAAVDPASGDLVAEFDPAVNGRVLALAADAGRLYLGGEFGQVGPERRGNLAVVDQRTGALDPDFDPIRNSPPATPEGPQRGEDVTGSVFRLRLAAGRLYVAGKLRAVAGHSRNNVAAVHARTGAIDRDFDPSADAEVRDLAVLGDRVFLAGSFGRVAGTPAPTLAAVDARTGTPDPAFRFPLAPGATAVATDGRRVYVGGRSHEREGEKWEGIRALDPVTGAVDPSFAPALFGRPWTIVVAGGRLYAGGGIHGAGAQERRHLAAIDLRTGRLDPTLTDGPERPMGRFQAVGERLYAKEVDDRGFSRPRLQAWDARTGQPDEGFETPSVAPMDVWLPSARGIYVVQPGRRVRRARRVRIVALDPQTGRRLADFRFSRWGTIHDLAVHGGRLYVAGRLRSRVRGPVTGVIAVDAGTGRQARGFHALRRPVQSITALGGRLYLEGCFGRVGGVRRPGLAAVSLRTGAVDEAFAPPRDRNGLPRCRGSSRPQLTRAGLWIYRGGRVFLLDRRTGDLRGRHVLDPDYRYSIEQLVASGFDGFASNTREAATDSCPQYLLGVRFPSGSG